MVLNLDSEMKKSYIKEISYRSTRTWCLFHIVGQEEEKGSNNNYNIYLALMCHIILQALYHYTVFIH